MAATFNHFGVPTKEKREGESYYEGAGVHGTSPDDHPYRVEYLRFDADCPMHEAIQTRPHAAFMVDDLNAALEGQNIITEPFDVTDTLRVAFIMDGDAVIELMQTV